jgi:hypothetical protein
MDDDSVQISINLWNFRNFTETLPKTDIFIASGKQAVGRASQKNNTSTNAGQEIVLELLAKCAGIECQ